MQNINWHSLRTKVLLVIMFAAGLLPLLGAFPFLEEYTKSLTALGAVLLYVEHALQGNTSKPE